MNSGRRVKMADMTKEQAIERVTNVAKLVYSDYRKRRTEAHYEDILAFHLVSDRLNTLALEFGGNAVISVSTHPYYPVVGEVRYGTRWYWSHGFFHKWVNWYLPLMERIPELKAIAEAHRNEVEFAKLVQEEWAKVVTPYVASDFEQHANHVQDKWQEYEAKQLGLFGNLG